MLSFVQSLFELFHVAMMLLRVLSGTVEGASKGSVIVFEGLNLALKMRDHALIPSELGAGSLQFALEVVILAGEGVVGFTELALSFQHVLPLIFAYTVIVAIMATTGMMVVGVRAFQGNKPLVTALRGFDEYATGRHV